MLHKGLDKNSDWKWGFWGLEKCMSLAFQSFDEYRSLNSGEPGVKHGSCAL